MADEKKQRRSTGRNEEILIIGRVLRELQTIETTGGRLRGMRFVMDALQEDAARSPMIPPPNGDTKQLPIPGTQPGEGLFE